MKPKSLIPLVIIVAILAGWVAYKKTSQHPQTMIEQTKLVKLLPDGFSKSDVARIELCSGDKTDEKLVLTYDKGADKWRVTNHFNAPAKKETVDKYLDAIAKMKGEPRTMGASEAALADYNLTDAKAFHIAGFKEGGVEPIFKLLVGKAPGYKEVFVRKGGGNDVFVDDTNLKQQAGINDDTPRPSRAGQPKAEKAEEKPLPKPEAATWLDKEIVKVDSAKLTKITLNLPDKSLVFERREKPKPPAPPAPSTPPDVKDEAVPQPAGSSEAQPGSAPSITVTPSGTPAASPVVAAPSDKPEYEWVLTSGGAGLTLKPKSIDTFIARFAPLNATDIVDPAKKADWALDKPAFACILSVEGQPDIRIEGGRPANAKGDGYVRIAEAKEDIVYSLAKYSFEQIFPKGADFFDLPALTFDKKAIDAVNITGPGGNIVLARSGETLNVTQPACDLKPITTSVDNIVNTLAALRPADYADGDPGLGEPTRTVTFTAAGQPHNIKVFTDSKSSDGAYAKIDDKPEILVIAKADLGKAFPTPNDLFERKLFDVEADDIAEIAVQTPSQNFSAALTGDNWKITASGNTLDANPQACKELAEAFASAQGGEILFGKADFSAPADSTVRVKTKEGVEHTLACAPDKDGKREIKVSGKKEIFTMPTVLANVLFPDLEKMKQPAPQPVVVQTPPPAPAESAPTPVVVQTPPPAVPTPAPVPVEQPKPEVATPQPPSAPVVVQTPPPAPAPESK